MCLFITAVVPRAGMTDAMAGVVTKHRLSFAPCENQYVEAQLRPSERYVYATGAYCDCGSPLFFGREPASPEEIARQVAKLRKKKWSDAKIQRWLEATSPRPNDPNASPNGHRSVNEWSDFLDGVLRLPKVAYVGLVGHTYSGDVSTEEVTLTERVRYAPADLRDGRLGTLAEDVLYEFRSSAKPSEAEPAPLGARRQKR